MKKFLQFLAISIVFSVFSFLVLVYTDRETRQAMITLLAKKELADARSLQRGSLSPYTATALGSLGSDVPIGISLATSTATTTRNLLVTPIAATEIKVASDTPRTFKYKLVRDVDPCTLNKLGGQGWQPIQFGGNLGIAPGSDENCQNSRLYDALDWVLFSQ